MSIAPNNARLLVLTSRKSDLEYRLTMMMSTTQQLAQESADVTAQKSAAIQQYITSVTNSQDSAPVLNPGYSAQVSDLDAQLAQIAVAQKKLDIEQKKIETNLNAVNTEEDQVQKTLDNSIKNEIGYFKD